MRGTDDKESPDINFIRPPVSLKIDDLVAVTTWLYVHDGQRPPFPAVIVKAFRKFMTPQDWKYVTAIPPPLTVVSLLATGEEPVEEIFRKALCVACHIIPEIPDALRAGPYGALAPALTMKSFAPLRLKDPLYKGKATTVREFITESILHPSVYVAGYPDNTIPKNYGYKLDALAIDKMVDYLAEVEDGNAPPPIK